MSTDGSPPRPDAPELAPFEAPDDDSDEGYVEDGIYDTPPRASRRARRPEPDDSDEGYVADDGYDSYDSPPPRASRRSKRTRKRSVRVERAPKSSPESSHKNIFGGDEDAAEETSVHKLKRLGDYKIKRVLGEGGMGLVFKAVEQALKRPVALKVLHTSYNNDETFLQRFLVEARAAASLDHPNIVKVYAVGRDQETGRAYMAMEYLPGRTLEKALGRNKLTFGNILHVAMSVASALGHAREKNIVHRDIKPTNIILGPKKSVSLLDFGVAKVLRGESKKKQNMELTQIGTVLGSPEYMSPEQSDGSELDIRSDMYSLGVILYEMLADNKPFEGKTAHSLAQMHAYSHPRSIRLYRKNVPKEFEGILSNLLAKDRENRYSRPRKVYLDLKALKVKLESQGRMEELPEGPAVPPLTIAEAENFDQQDVINTRSKRVTRIRIRTWEREKTVAALLLAFALGFGCAWLVLPRAGAPPVAAVPAELVERVVWGQATPLWPEGAQHQGVGAVRWFYDAEGPFPGAFYGQGTGFLRTALPAAGAWRVEGVMLDAGGDQVVSIDTAEQEGAVGLSLRHYDAVTVIAVRLLLPGRSAPVLLEPVQLPAHVDRVPFVITVLRGAVFLEAGDNRWGPQALAAEPSGVSLSVQSAGRGRAAFGALFLKTGSDPDG